MGGWIVTVTQQQCAKPGLRLCDGGGGGLLLPMENGPHVLKTKDGQGKAGQIKK